MSLYGKKGGTSFSAGRKAEILIDPVSGTRVRNFKGHRWLSVVQQHEFAEMFVCTHATSAEAQKHMENVSHAFTHDLESWQRMDQQRHVFRALPVEPPYGQPDVEYITPAIVI